MDMTYAPGLVPETIGIGGVFRLECYDPKQDKVLWVAPLKNGVTTAGLNHILNVEFGGTTQVATWYFGLVSSSGFSAFSAADTMGSHTGWSEQTGYDEAARQTWSVGAASGGIITNGTVATFTATSSMGVQGAFVTSSSTKGGTTGTLWATSALANAPQTIPAGLTVRLTYTLTATAT